MKVTHEAGSVATKNLLDGQCEVFGPICRCDADGDGDILMGGVHYAHHGDKEIV